jgi:hypothetical protein
LVGGRDEAAGWNAGVGDSCGEEVWVCCCHYVLGFPR